MSTFPVQSGDVDSLTEGVNYLLSGPGGLGQNFQGFSTYQPGYLTGNFRPPFTNTTGANLYVSGIPLGVSEMLDGRTWKYTFATPEASPPFVPGQSVSISGVADPYFDGDYSVIGVAECTVDYVILRTQTSFAIEPPSSGGVAFSYITLASDNDTFTSTDANGKVTINGATDRVFLSAQLNNIISYIDATATNFEYTVQINRLVGFINNDPVNPEYRFVQDGIVAQKVYNYTLTGSGNLDNIETIFTAIIDNPTIGYYWYILEVQFKNLDWDGTGAIPDFQVTTCEFAQRGLSAQVVKQ